VPAARPVGWDVVHTLTTCWLVFLWEIGALGGLMAFAPQMTVFPLNRFLFSFFPPTSHNPSSHAWFDFAVISVRAQAFFEAEIKDQPLVGAREGVDTLRDVFASAPRFLSKMPDLERVYASIRKVRGDGDCFYRAYLYSCLELASVDAAVLADLTGRVEALLGKLLAAGFPDFAIEDAHEEFVALLKWIHDEHPAPDVLLQKLETDSLFQYLIMLARFVTSFHLQTNAEQFQPYIADGRTVLEVCKADVCLCVRARVCVCVCVCVCSAFSFSRCCARRPSVPLSLMPLSGFTLLCHIWDTGGAHAVPS
jgi:hypothetical protein